MGLKMLYPAVGVNMQLSELIPAPPYRLLLVGEYSMVELHNCVASPCNPQVIKSEMRCFKQQDVKHGH